MAFPVCARTAANSAAFVLGVEAREPAAVVASCGISVPRRVPVADFVPAPGAPDAPEDASPARALPLLAAKEGTAASSCSPAEQFGPVAGSAESKWSRREEQKAESLLPVAAVDPVGSVARAGLPVTAGRTQA